MILVMIIIVIIATAAIVRKLFNRRVSIIDYNVRYPPYVNVAKIVRLGSSKHGSFEKANKLIMKDATKMNVEYIPIDELLTRSLNYSSKKFYNDIMIKKRYKAILQRVFGVMIVKSESPLVSDGGILSVGYLKTDRLDTVLYKMLMKLKLTYGLDYSIKDVKKLIDASGTDVSCMEYETFNEFINSDKLKDLMGNAFGFKFINH